MRSLLFSESGERILVNHHKFSDLWPNVLWKVCLPESHFHMQLTTSLKKCTNGIWNGDENHNWKHRYWRNRLSKTFLPYWGVPQFKFEWATFQLFIMQIPGPNIDRLSWQVLQPIPHFPQTSARKMPQFNLRPIYSMMFPCLSIRLYVFCFQINY
jgi:hypothetical protein